MPDRNSGAQRLVDDRSPFVTIEAILTAAAEFNPSMPDAEAVWNAYIDTKGKEHREYLTSIRESRHSVFWYMHHEIYEFCIELSGKPSAEFCPVAGRTFMNLFFLENVYPFLKVALAARGDFQVTIVEMLTAYLHRYASARYRLSHDIREDHIALTLESHYPDLARTYLEEHGLTVARSFLNSFGFVWGAFDAFLTQVVSGYDAAAVECNVTEEQKGTMRFPVSSQSQFTYESLITTLMGYTNELMRRQKNEAEDERREHDLIMASSAMRRTWNRIRKASRSDEIVLLRGESGTGKSFIAHKIHEMSPRRAGPFVEVCLTSDIGSDNMIQSDLFGHRKGAFTGAVEHKQGLFSLADGGTIFLDEIGDASGELQAKLLRVLENSTFRKLGESKDITVDVRVIVATNRDLEQMVEEGTFRQDLYYRINVIPVELPALRDRPEDIQLLAQFLLTRSSKTDQPKVLEPGLASGLRKHAWPGNIRELDHALKHATAMADGEIIHLDDLPGTIQKSLSAGSKPAPATATGAAGVADTDVLNVEALRRSINGTDPESLDSSETNYEHSAHVNHAKRIYLATLIDELGGDITAITRYWDRNSTKTIRKLIHDFGLADELEAARQRGPRPRGE
jgi:DNA-binding NtrC family response regulator